MLQYLVSFGLIFLIAGVAFFTVDLIGYKVVALILLMAVSLLAMLFDIWPVVVAAVFSALLWNFLFIPPILNFTINNPEDALLFLMYFVIATLNAVLTSKIRKAEIRAKEEEERKLTIRLYNTLLNSLSHELKTPISTIIGAVDTLKETPTRLSEIQKAELLAEIDLAGVRLNRQVENLLNMSRLESGFIQPQRDWCDISELIHQVMQDLREDSTAHRLIVESAEEFPLFKLDRGLIQQVLHNIIHNALQYTPAGSVITIRATHREQACQIIVQDNGPGFPPDELEAVFRKFYRLSQSAAGGTGLGLSIAKGFVEAHSGHISLENLPQGGAKFTVVIPAPVAHLNDVQND